MKLRNMAFFVLLLALLLHATPAQANAARLAWQAGKFLLNLVIGYEAGKGFDKLLGIDFERDLKKLETDLQTHAEKGAEEAREVQRSLEAVRSQQAILKALLNSKPNSSDLERFKSQLSADIEALLEEQNRLSKIQQEHGQRIAELEQRFAEHSTRLQRLEQRGTEAPSRAGQERRATRDSPQGPSLQDGTTTPGRKVDRLRPRNQEREQDRAVPLEVRLTGHANTITIRETRNVNTADNGSFNLEGAQQDHSFSLLQGKGAVILLVGNDNAVRLPRRLCGRVRVVPRGTGNRVEGCR